MKNPLVILIGGPTGVGKTTLAEKLSQHYNCPHLSEDEIARGLFPDEYTDIEVSPEKMKVITNLLFKRAKEIFDDGNCVVIDSINLEKEFIEEIQKTFNQNLILEVLWPPMETTIERDKRREGWTSGEKAIKFFYQKYEELKPLIGEQNYIDNSQQTPDETLEKFIRTIDQFR